MWLNVSLNFISKVSRKKMFIETLILFRWFIYISFSASGYFIRNQHEIHDFVFIISNSKFAVTKTWLSTVLFLLRNLFSYTNFLLQSDNEHCMLLALPCGRDHMDVLQQSNNLQSGFITYLQQKQAAGIINIAGPGSQQVRARLIVVLLLLV